MRGLKYSWTSFLAILYVLFFSTYVFSIEDNQISQLTNLAEKGDIDAAYNLAHIYYFGKNVPADQAKAEKLFKQVVEQSLTHAVQGMNAFIRMAMFYHHGIKEQRDFQKAAYWYKKSAGLGYCPAFMELASIYRYGGYGVEINIEKSLYWIKQAAEYDYRAAQSTLADFYQTGELGLPIDSEKSNYWRKKSNLPKCHQNPECEKFTMGSYFCLYDPY